MNTDAVDARPSGAEAQVTLYYRGCGAISKTRTSLRAACQRQNDSAPYVFTLQSRFFFYRSFTLARLISVETFLFLVHLPFGAAAVQRKG